MKRPVTTFFLSAFPGAMALLLVANSVGPRAHQDFQLQPQHVSSATPVVATTANASGKQEPPAKPEPTHYAYHKKPPTGPLPPTLDPAQFVDNQNAFVTYFIAAKIRELLYQEPCTCPCNKFQGHQSLLDCYTSAHGQRCGACQSEVIFCYEQRKQGKSPKQIRKALLAKIWINQDINKYSSNYKSAMAQPKE